MDLVMSNSSGTTGAAGDPYLNPNNTTYSNAFAEREFYVNSNESGLNIQTLNAFRLAANFTSPRVSAICCCDV